MTFTEFNEYRKNFFSMKVNKDGTISNDNNVRFSLKLIKGEETDPNIPKINEAVIAKSYTEALYNSIISIIFSNMPSQDSLKELSTKYFKASTNEEKAAVFEELKNNINLLKSFTTFSRFNVRKVDNGIEILFKNAYDNECIYSLTVNDTQPKELQEKIKPLEMVEIEDNMVLGWFKEDNKTMICHIVNSPYTINYPFKNSELPSDIEVLDSIYNTCMQYIRSITTIAYYIGFSSVLDEADYDQNTAIYISLQRALIEKINLDKANLKTMIKSSKSFFNQCKKEISKKEKTYKLLKKRKSQLIKSIRDKIASM